jgi:hypothetical protein
LLSKVDRDTKMKTASATTAVYLAIVIMALVPAAYAERRINFLRRDGPSERADNKERELLSLTLTDAPTDTATAVTLGPIETDSPISLLPTIVPTNGTDVPTAIGYTIDPIETDAPTEVTSSKASKSSKKSSKKSNRTKKIKDPKSSKAPKLAKSTKARRAQGPSKKRARK